MRTTTLAIVSALLALVLLGGCNESNHPPSDPAKSPTGLSRVSGAALKPAEGATIYLYRPGDDLRGPPFTRIGPLDGTGQYEIELPAGDYVLLVRQRADGEESGPVRDGDLKSDPVTITVEAGKPLGLDLVAYVKQGNEKESFGEETEWKTSLSGRVTDPEGNPVEGVRIHAYDHVQMSERPKFVSPRTGPDGRYTLQLPEGGTYYICARDQYGGPPKVGDLYGRYDKGTVEPSAVILTDGEALEAVDIVVHTVW